MFKVKDFFNSSQININYKVDTITDDIIELTDNSIYFAYKSITKDRHDSINDAISFGCKTIVYEDDDVIKHIKYANFFVNFIKVNDVKTKYNECLNIFYKQYIKGIKFIGVTGTNGKTTTTRMIHSYLISKRKSSLLVGTNQIVVNEDVFESKLTTPNLKVIYEYLKNYHYLNIKYCILEVSSHAIKQNRISSINFDYLLFTNLSSDHLDYHKNYQDYFHTKMKLFLQNKKAVKIINYDDLLYDEIKSTIGDGFYTYSVKSRNANYYAFDIDLGLKMTNFKLNDGYYIKYVSTNVVSLFNIQNYLAAILLISKIGLPTDDFISFMKKDFVNKGRLEYIKKANKIFIVDFAHSPDSVKQVLKFIKERTDKHICTVIGCPGERDRIKRSKIGLIATKYSDYVYFTNDNPRYEDEDQIISDITKDIKTTNYRIELDRRKVLLNLFSFPDNYIFIILGKGDEKYQVIKNDYINHSDIEIIKTFKGE